MGVSFNKPIRVSCPIPFKSQVRFAPWWVAIMMADFPSAKKKRFTGEETDLLVREVKALCSAVLCYMIFYRYSVKIFGISDQVSILKVINTMLILPVML